MARCGSGCASDCRRSCGHDHGSKAERRPDLLSIEVVEGLLGQACRNMKKRFDAELSGEMSAEEHVERTEALVDWLTLTFAGENPHFEDTGEWLPAGLAEYLRETDETLRAGFPSDRTVIERAVRQFVAETAGALEYFHEPPTEGSVDDFLGFHGARWARRLTGMYEG